MAWPSGMPGCCERHPATCAPQTPLLLQLNTSTFLNATTDPAQLRAAALYGLQQEQDCIRNATTAVAVPGTSFGP